MNDLFITIALCVVVAVVYASAALIQARVAHLSVRELLKVPVWWLAQLLNVAGAGLHVLSLNFGPLSLIQPLGVLTLVIAVPLTASAGHRRVTRLEAVGMGCTVIGLAGLTMLITTGGRSDTLTNAELSGLLLATTVLVALLGVKGSRPGASPLWEAVAGGIAFAVCSALCQTVVRTLEAEGPGVLLRLGTLLTVVAIVAFAIAATVLTQQSYRSGLGAPLAVTNLVNPASATAIGVVFLGEELATNGLLVVLAVACAALAAFGVTRLARARDVVPAAIAETSPATG
ncbi:DMT family transporter [Actinokineospora sp. PR83]|uniref:DMT family transporter n=1 Tax=Actinokineospora sp. PR83 TaxID=2884908 RepID=UPI001F2450CD|nr:DMT family transporter [Actinokineospora sp. PR83]MCG8920742.1 DMT family transporter [Actinokineospora sp. PR83]